jgi:hypothetical protein
MAVTSNDSTKMSTVSLIMEHNRCCRRAIQNGFAKDNAFAAFIERPLDLNIYPNPARKNFSIDFTQEKQDNAVVSIIEIGTAELSTGKPFEFFRAIS